MSLAAWLAFFVAAWAISFSPGPAVVFSMSNGVNYGFRRGHVAVYGLALGVGTMMITVAVGVGALLVASPVAFAAVKWFGVGYLAYLGIKQLLSKQGSLISTEQRDTNVTPRELIFKGWLLNATNPKGVVFLMAVTPQFVDASKPVLMQYVVITLTLMFTEMVAMSIYTAFASRVLSYFRSPGQMLFLNRLFGGLFVAAAAFLATFKRGA